MSCFYVNSKELVAGYAVVVGMVVIVAEFMLDGRLCCCGRDDGGSDRVHTGW